LSIGAWDLGISGGGVTRSGREKLGICDAGARGAADLYDIDVDVKGRVVSMAGLIDIDVEVEGRIVSVGERGEIDDLYGAGICSMSSAETFA